MLPAYVIEPPDLLTVEAIHMVPKQPYHLQGFDSLFIQVEGAPAEAPIAGIYPIGADGTILLGVHYGSIYVAGRDRGRSQSTHFEAACHQTHRPRSIRQSRRQLGPAADLRPAPGRHGRHDHPGNIRKCVCHRPDRIASQGGHRTTSVAVLRQPGSLRGSWRLQQQGLLHRDPRRRFRRRRLPLSDDRKRNGARRPIADQRAAAGLVQEKSGLHGRPTTPIASNGWK